MVKSTKPRRSAEDDMRKQLRGVEKEATPDDIAAVERLIARARGSKHDVAMYSFTPAQAAIVFNNHNPRNREFNAHAVHELMRQINLDDYKFNGQGVGFYNTGELDDGQHRLAANALTGRVLETPVSFGISQDAAPTIDSGGAGTRDGAAAGKIIFNLEDGKPKQTVLRNAYRYYYNIGKEPEFKIRTASEMMRALHDNDHLLIQAITLGESSREQISAPSFKQTDAAAIAFILLKAGMQPEKALEHLRNFQTGVQRLGENEAHYAGTKVVRDNRSKVAKKGSEVEKLNAMREYGIVVVCIKAAEAGVVPTAKQLRDAVAKGKSLPDPRPDGAEEIPEAAE